MSDERQELLELLFATKNMKYKISHLINLLISFSFLLGYIGLRVTVSPQRDPVAVTAVARREHDVGLIRSFH